MNNLVHISVRVLNLLARLFISRLYEAALERHRAVWLVALLRVKVIQCVAFQHEPALLPAQVDNENNNNIDDDANEEEEKHFPCNAKQSA